MLGAAREKEMHCLHRQTMSLDCAAFPHKLGAYLLKLFLPNLSTLQTDMLRLHVNLCKFNLCTLHIEEKLYQNINLITPFITVDNDSAFVILRYCMGMHY